MSDRDPSRTTKIGHCARFEWQSRYRFRTKTETFRHDDDATWGNVETLRIALLIKTYRLARWNHHVLVNDAPPELCSFLDMDVLEED